MYLVTHRIVGKYTEHGTIQHVPMAQRILGSTDDRKITKHNINVHQLAAKHSQANFITSHFRPLTNYNFEDPPPTLLRTANFKSPSFPSP